MIWLSLRQWQGTFYFHYRLWHSTMMPAFFIFSWAFCSILPSSGCSSGRLETISQVTENESTTIIGFESNLPRKNIEHFLVPFGNMRLCSFFLFFSFLFFFFFLIYQCQLNIFRIFTVKQVIWRRHTGWFIFWHFTDQTINHTNNQQMNQSSWTSDFIRLVASWTDLLAEVVVTWILFCSPSDRPSLLCVLCDAFYNITAWKQRRVHDDTRSWNEYSSFLLLHLWHKLCKM